MKRSIKYCCCSLLMLIFIQSISAQELLPLQQLKNYQLERLLIQKNSLFHAGLQPYRTDKINEFADADSIFIANRTDYSESMHYLHRKLRYENFIIVDTSNFFLTIDPIVNLQFAREIAPDLNKTNFFINSRGGRNVPYFRLKPVS